MNVLEKIVEIKRKYLEIKRIRFPINILEKSRYFNRETYSLYKKISKYTIGIIAEFKRESPSKRIIINSNLPIEKIIMAYKKAGVIGVSILTDFPSFNGKEQDIIKTRQIVQLPLLYKDIIIDEYQIVLAKAIGSDIVLLIAKILSKKKIITLTQTAKSLNLEVILELHNYSENYKTNEDLHIIGVNNRDLRSFSVNLENSKEFSRKLYKKLKISESGIFSLYQISFLSKKGFNGFLIGENFLRKINSGICYTNF